VTTRAAVGAPHAGSAGRVCPTDYRYEPAVFAREPDLICDVLYVVGGLYGNLAALDTIERLAAAEHATVVLNGDFHWFDAAPEWLAEVERRVGRHRAMRGNVETEIARADDIGAGCGCAYPETVDEDVVRRSNDILLQLRGAARSLPGVCARLAALPMHLVATVGRLRIGIVHGDASSLAGWSFAHDRLADTAASHELEAVHRAARVDVFASTHTCLAALRDAALPSGRLTVINNGAAGMPNFRGRREGVISRIAVTPSPHRSLYGLRRDGVHIDAVPVPYDERVFRDRFLAHWPAGSAAHASYFVRIEAGPDHTLATANLAGRAAA
jgi:hypothetical protein